MKGKRGVQAFVRRRKTKVKCMCMWENEKVIEDIERENDSNE